MRKATLFYMNRKVTLFFVEPRAIEVYGFFLENYRGGTITVPPSDEMNLLKVRFGTMALQPAVAQEKGQSYPVVTWKEGKYTGVALIDLETILDHVAETAE